VCTFFQRAKLHSGRRWFTNWTRNPDHAGIFSDWERGRCKSCGGSTFRAERWKQIGRASNFTDFYFQGARKRPLRKFCNPKDLPRDRNFCVVDWRDDLYLCIKIRYRKDAAHYLLALSLLWNVRYIIILYLLWPRHSNVDMHFKKRNLNIKYKIINYSYSKIKKNYFRARMHRVLLNAIQRISDRTFLKIVLKKLFDK